MPVLDAISTAGPAFVLLICVPLILFSQRKARS